MKNVTLMDWVSAFLFFLLGLYIFIDRVTKLECLNKEIMWASGGLALTAIGFSYILYLKQKSEK